MPSGTRIVAGVTEELKLYFYLSFIHLNFLKVEMKFTEHKSNRLKRNNSTAFGAFTVLRYHHLYPVPKRFIAPRGTLCPVGIAPHFLLPQLQPSVYACLHGFTYPGHFL